MKTATRARRVTADDLRRGDTVRIGKRLYRVQWIQWVNMDAGQAWVIVHGPLGLPTAHGGQAFYAGTKPLRRTNPLGERETIQPAVIYLEGGR